MYMLKASIRSGVAFSINILSVSFIFDAANHSRIWDVIIMVKGKFLK